MAEPEIPPSPEGAHGASRTRRIANAFIALFLAYQVVTPISYYASERVYDERFGWRMFSTLRLQACEIAVEEIAEKGGSPRPVTLSGKLHVAWINLLKRGWPRVIERYLITRCASQKIAEVRLHRKCRATDGSQLAPERFTRTCGSGEVRTGEPAK
jgi:hypothetical protein